MSKKVKKSSSNILDKVRVLDEFKLPENQRKMTGTGLTQKLQSTTLGTKKRKKQSTISDFFAKKSKK